MKAIERVFEIMQQKGLKPAAVERDLSLSNGYLAKMHKTNGQLGEEVLIKLSSYLESSLEYLLIGGENLGERKSSYEAKENKPVVLAEDTVKYTDNGKPIPLIPYDAMAGYGSGDVQAMEYESERYMIPTFKNADFLMPVRGASMSPKYDNGDIVACKRLKTSTFFQWNKVYVLDTEQGPLIKRVCEGKDTDHLRLVSDNKDYPPFEIHKNEIRALAMVLGAIKLE
jgi:repressor LexA